MATFEGENADTATKSIYSHTPRRFWISEHCILFCV